MVNLSSLSTTPCNFIPSGVTTVAVSYSCEKSFIGSDNPVASRLLGLRTDSARYSRDRDVPVELRSGPSRPPLPLTMWQVPQAALPSKRAFPCAAFGTCPMVRGKGGRLGPDLRDRNR